MKFGMTVIGVVLLTGTVTFGQTATDMATLERKLQDAQAAFARVEPSGVALELNELQDELAYLRVKARRGETVTQRERRDVGDRIDRLNTRIASGQTTTNNARNRDNVYGGTRDNSTGNRDNTVGTRDNSTTGRRNGMREIPSGTEVDVRLQSRLDSKTAMVEDRVEATTLVDLYQGNDLLVPAGSLLVGHVTAVEKATRLERKGSITVEFSRLTVNGRTRDVDATVTQALESGGLKDEAARIGTGAGVGAIIGGILGGVKGAIAGILIGGGGVVAATEGKDVELEPGTVLRVRFDSNVPLF
ncbi:MAG: hypothetical protein Q7R30_04195 [Acidobacteriota bacterium]|nr:hypothetical protein [Acidobacteriota bacterium]